ncbi:MAG: hypothetical protein AB7K86_23400 [Rhodospirillales bacterium]
MKQARTAALIATMTAALGMQSAAQAGEETTISAFSVWNAQGQTLQTGPSQATFIGVLSGPLYVETERGPVGAGEMSCAATVEFRLDNGRQVGGGRCAIVAPDGAKTFAEITCEGVHLIGCDGAVTVVGGTERFAGIKGDGRIVLRSDHNLIMPTSGVSAREQARGIAYFRKIRYELP